MRRLLLVSGRSRFLLLLLIVLPLAAGCGPKTFDDPEAFDEYVRAADGPFVQTSEQENVQVKARYMPADAMALSSIRRAERDRASLLKNTSLTDSARSAHLQRIRSDVEARRADFRKALYFSLTIEPTEGDLVYDTLQRQGYGAYQKWLNRLLFGLQKKIYLRMDDGTEVPLSIYRMQRSFGMSKSRTFLLAFPTTFNDRDVRAIPVDLVIEEFGLRTGAISFSFDIDHLAQAVRLQL